MASATKKTSLAAMCAALLLIAVPSVADVIQAKAQEETTGRSLQDSSSQETCSTYLADVALATSLIDTCEWNMYMCCWTANNGPDGMSDNTDVCRVLDYPKQGNTLELPRDDEGEAYCHGFAWPDGADPQSYVLPLYNYVTNYQKTEEGGFLGNIDGSPECGCIEEMPQVSSAGCTRHLSKGFGHCPWNDLKTQYSRLGKPKGQIDWNLVEVCDNEESDDLDYASCEYNTYMCCWTENDGQGMEDNTDVCRVVDYPEDGDTLEFPGDTEKVHCHGLVWPEDATDSYIRLLAQYVQTFDHIDTRGYYGNIEGAPACGCIEDMPIVSRADCTTFANENTNTFKACTNNDLRTRYEEVYPNGKMSNLVDACDNE